MQPSYRNIFTEFSTLPLQAWFLFFIFIFLFLLIGNQKSIINEKKNEVIETNNIANKEKSGN